MRSRLFLPWVTDTCSSKTTITVLPLIDKYVYSSTVLVPKGPVPVLNKRDSASPAAAAAMNEVNTTPTPLAGFSASILSKACSSLYPCPTTTITVSSTKEIKCKTTITTTKTRYVATITETQTATPPPNTISRTGVLTTTVPAACAFTPYEAQSQPEDTAVFFAEYPDQPSTRVECCVVCAKTKNCVAAAQLPAGECQLLTTTVHQGSGESGKCPLGIVDFDYSVSNPDGFVLPGPCGK